MPKGQDPNKTPSHHTPDFYIDESGMQTGIKAFLYLVTDYLQTAGNLKGEASGNAKQGVK